jgi:hypothetical protein
MPISSKELSKVLRQHGVNRMYELEWKTDVDIGKIAATLAQGMLGMNRVDIFDIKKELELKLRRSSGGFFGYLRQQGLVQDRAVRNNGTINLRKVSLNETDKKKKEQVKSFLSHYQVGSRTLKRVNRKREPVFDEYKEPFIDKVKMRLDDIAYGVEDKKRMLQACFLPAGMAGERGISDDEAYMARLKIGLVGIAVLGIPAFELFRFFLSNKR